MDRVEIVRVVPDLDVPFRVRTHGDGTQSVDVRAGLPLIGSVASLINQLYFQRGKTCLADLAATLKTASPDLTDEHAASLARAIAEAAVHQNAAAEQGTAREAFCSR